jgi:hypothetical protein
VNAASGSFNNRVVQKLQFLNNNRLKWQNAEHFAGLVSQLEVGREPTGFLNKSSIFQDSCPGGIPIRFRFSNP